MTTKNYTNIPDEFHHDPNLRGRLIRMLLLGRIISYTKTGEFHACVSSNKALAELFGVDVGTIRNEISALRKLGYIEDLPTKRGRKLVSIWGKQSEECNLQITPLSSTNDTSVIHKLRQCNPQMTNNRGNSNVNSNFNTNCSSNATPSPTTTGGLSASAADSAIIAFQKRFCLSTHPHTVAEIHRQVSARGVSDVEIVDTIRDTLNAYTDGVLWAGEEIDGAFDSARNADFAAVSLILN